MTRAASIGAMDERTARLLADGKPGELPRGLMMGAGWIINVIIAEWIIRRRAPRATSDMHPFLA